MQFSNATESLNADSSADYLTVKADPEGNWFTKLRLRGPERHAPARACGLRQDPSHRTADQPATANRSYSTGSVENNWLRMPSSSAFLTFCWNTTSAETTD